MAHLGRKKQIQGKYEVEKNIPIIGTSRAGFAEKYPEIFTTLKTLKVGDSVKFPIDEEKFFKSIATGIKRRDEEHYLVFRKVDKEYGRVWRTKDPSKMGPGARNKS